VPILQDYFKLVRIATPLPAIVRFCVLLRANARAIAEFAKKCHNLNAELEAIDWFPRRRKSASLAFSGQRIDCA
jgi:hypothetical protein